MHLLVDEHAGNLDELSRLEIGRYFSDNYDKNSAGTRVHVRTCTSKLRKTRANSVTRDYVLNVFHVAVVETFKTSGARSKQVVGNAGKTTSDHTQSCVLTRNIQQTDSRRETQLLHVRYY